MSPLEFFLAVFFVVGHLAAAYALVELLPRLGRDQALRHFRYIATEMDAAFLAGRLRESGPPVALRRLVERAPEVMETLTFVAFIKSAALAPRPDGEGALAAGFEEMEEDERELFCYFMDETEGALYVQIVHGSTSGLIALPFLLFASWLGSDRSRLWESGAVRRKAVELASRIAGKPKAFVAALSEACERFLWPQPIAT